MSADRDIHRTVEYYGNPGRQFSFAAWSFFMAMLCFLLSYRQPDFAILGWVTLVIAAALFVWFLWCKVSPGKPVLLVWTQGIHYRLSGVGEFFIPWQEIRGIETATFSRGSGKRRVRFKDVTLVLVSDSFYQAEIHEPSAFRRGPYWDAFFRPAGDGVGIALHHDKFSIAPRNVRGPIERRWQAFRDAPPPASRPQAPVRPAFGREGAPLVYGTTIFASGRDTAMIAAPLLGGLVMLGNVTGVWETPGQATARVDQEAREARMEGEREYWRRHREAMEERDAKWEEMFQRLR